MCRGEAQVEYKGYEGVGEQAAGTVGIVPVDAGGGDGVAGGAAHGVGGALGVAEGQVDAGAVEVAAAVLLVVVYGAVGVSPFFDIDG